jgi:hypothetical protein
LIPEAPMSTREYTLSGRVVDRTTQAGIPNLTVEAWDRDTRFHDMLGSTLTNTDGAFWIRLGAEYFGDYGGDLAPDVFFRVYRDQQLIKSTQEEPRMNVARGETSVLIEIDQGSAPVGTDRVTSEQMFKAVMFLHESDFAGVAREQRDKVKATGNLLAAMAVRTLKDFDFEPVKPTGTRTNDVVGRDSNTATRNLAANGVVVSEVRTYNPRLNSESVQAVKSLPRKLKADDKVILYQEEGVVRYYTIERALAPKDVDAADVARIDGEVATLKGSVTELTQFRGEVDALKETHERERTLLSNEVAGMKSRVDEVSTLQRQVAELRQSTTAKDVEIARLKEEVQTMRTAQDELVQRVSPEKINQIEEQLRRLSERRPVSPIEPVTPVRPVGRTAAKTTRKKKKDS